MRVKALMDVKVVGVSTSCCSVHMFAISDEGHVYGWGRNEKGQLGIGDTKDKKCPTLVKGLTGHKIVSVATGRNHSLFLTGKKPCCKYWSPRLTLKDIFTFKRTPRL
jgi:alpha-tubulin suppressor-like RCC1 family protein